MLRFDEARRTSQDIASTEDGGKLGSSNDAESSNSVGVIETIPGKHEAKSRIPRWLRRNRKIAGVVIALSLIAIVVPSAVVSVSKSRDHDRNKTK